MIESFETQADKVPEETRCEIECLILPQLKGLRPPGQTQRRAFELFDQYFAHPVEKGDMDLGCGDCRKRVKRTLERAVQYWA